MKRKIPPGKDSSGIFASFRMVKAGEWQRPENFKSWEKAKAGNLTICQCILKSLHQLTLEALRISKMPLWEHTASFPSFTPRCGAVHGVRRESIQMQKALTFFPDCELHHFPNGKTHLLSYDFLLMNQGLLKKHRRVVWQPKETCLHRQFAARITPCAFYQFF